jgi:hypothetical protein
MVLTEPVKEFTMKRTLVWLLPALGFLAWDLARAGADDQSREKKGTVVKLDGLQSRTPADWVEEKPTSNLRKYQFKIPRVKDEKMDAEVVIFSFGAGQGGSAAENIKRWKGFFIPPQGKTIDDVAKVTKMKVGGADVTYLDVQGTYKFKERPFDPSSKEELRPDSRMLGVVFESQGGPFFIRLVGPAKTVAQHKTGFDQWLKEFK